MDSPEQSSVRLKKLKDKFVPFTIGGSMGVGCSIVVMRPEAYATFQSAFSNGVGWGIAILCLLGTVVGGIAQALAMRFGLRGMNEIFLATPLLGVATSIAVMVGTGVATGVYRSISESTGWGVHAIATCFIGTCLMCLVGGLAGSFANMFVKLIRKHVTA